MLGVDDVAHVQSHAWEIIEGEGDACRALLALCQAIGGVSSVASLHDPAEGNVTFSGCAHVDPALLNLLAERFSAPETNPQVAMLPRMRTSRLDHHERYISKRALNRTAYYHDFWLPSGVGEAGGMVLPMVDGRFAFATVGCAAGRDWLDADERHAAERMLDAITRAMAARARFMFDCATAHLNGVKPDAALLLDATGRLRLVNEAAAALFERGTLVAAGRHARPRDADAARTWDDHLADLTAGRPTPSFVVADGDRFACVSFEDGPSFREERSVLVTVRAARPMDWTDAALRAHFSFTPREAAVVLRLCRGDSTGRIAAETGLREGSVRAYLKHAFAKTSTRAQAELVQFVLRGSIPEI